ncbi:MAG: fructosamine kinase family protein [Chloroflexi bacterium]|nr:fructosamine kinase family protein [Chloroflexota bacterium]
MNVPPPVVAWLKSEGYGPITELHPVAGGCINNSARLTTHSGHSFFLKRNASAPETMFSREIEGLRALSVREGPRVPIPHLAGPDFLLLEDLNPAAPRGNYWESFGQQLAALHNHSGPKFGFESDNFIGSTPQSNPWTANGHEFFAKHRLGYQADLALQRGLINRMDYRAVLALAAELPKLVPEQLASLLHGDLWSGNAVAGSNGEPAIIDPAAHYGWAEAELGMTTLFGGFPEAFYRSYEQARPLEAGWRERLPIYNLYHLLNHVNLFGAGYLGQVRGILQQFG